MRELSRFSLDDRRDHNVGLVSASDKPRVRREEIMILSSSLLWNQIQSKELGRTRPGLSSPGK